jgi:hypothetical protein
VGPEQSPENHIPSSSGGSTPQPGADLDFDARVNAAHVALLDYLRGDDGASFYIGKHLAPLQGGEVALAFDRLKAVLDERGRDPASRRELAAFTLANFAQEKECERARGLFLVCENITLETGNTLLSRECKLRRSEIALRERDLTEAQDLALQVVKTCDKDEYIALVRGYRVVGEVYSINHDHDRLAQVVDGMERQFLANGGSISKLLHSKDSADRKTIKQIVEAQLFLGRAYTIEGRSRSLESRMEELLGEFDDVDVFTRGMRATVLYGYGESLSQFARIIDQEGGNDLAVDSFFEESFKKFERAAAILSSCGEAWTDKIFHAKVFEAMAVVSVKLGQSAAADDYFSLAQHALVGEAIVSEVGWDLFQRIRTQRGLYAPRKELSSAEDDGSNDD